MRSVRVPKKANAAEEQDFLNSFIRPDLARVGDAAARKNLGKALLAYVEHGVFDRDLRRCNVREQLDETYRLLRPGDIPCARWVSDGGKSLALGQQLAVNVAMRQLAHTGGGLLAVNGPPGTGKTTMLREVLAALLVERANRLATLKSPGDAFGAECGWTTSQRKRTFRLLRPEVTGFEIVVASANNGAVQNVTREIPLTEAVDGDWQSTAEYFPDLATGVFDASAWAMVAAELGSKDRRSRFVQDFWWGRRARGSEPARPGLKELLSGFETRPKVNWREAVSRFKAVFAQAQGLQAERERAYEAATALEELQPAIDGLSSGLRRLSAQRSDMNQALDVRQTALAAAEESLANWSSKKVVHQAAKPSTFSSRAAKSAWREAGDQLSISLSNAQQGATAAQRFVEQMGQQARALDGQIQETRGRLQERQMRRNALQAQAASARGRLGQAFQERWSALPEDDRELTALG